MTTSFKLNLRRGAVVTGKWKHSRYRVERLLGEGANGKVYLVHADRGWCALKVGMDAIDLQSEINVLQALEKQDRKQTYLYEVDDLLGEDGKEYPFYIMRYVRGVTISDFLDKNGSEWFPLIGLNLLGKLAELHRKGWVFGDLKIDNVLVADYGYVELVDYGGVTAMGKGIRQFTEIYDRGFWNAGSRSADARYDLFSFAVLCIMLHEPKKLHALTGGLPQIRSTEELERLIGECKGLAPVAGWLRQALGGQFFDASEGAEAWRRLLHRRDTRVKSAKTPGWLKGLAAVSAVVLGISVYWLLRSGI
ncbi:serine/threonine protein kinase [Paenibacillus sp. ATY16]|uniref:protein kinase domain-containing protein n=1 Tax=Paenibacillus sp. ATY16 TaxID=1759312 RepID=UPI00200C19D0|nr:serine/threonine protein kinase [Paenibacillus sp. ATY16]